MEGASEPNPIDPVEGRPAHPQVRWSAVVAGLALSAVVGAFVGALAWRSFSPRVGVAVGVGLTVIGASLNPVLWAAIFRARQRGAVRRRQRKPDGAAIDPAPVHRP